jgi:hypothetical protein
MLRKPGVSFRRYTDTHRIQQMSRNLGIRRETDGDHGEDHDANREKISFMEAISCPGRVWESRHRRYSHG